MSFFKEVWETFDGVRVTPLVSKNNNTEYITWSKVWTVIMQHYPASDYTFDERDVISMNENGPVKTVEISCTLTIVENATRPRKAVRTMHLPVMIGSVPFSAIENPTSRHISDARMRCLVKTAAMFGLGLRLWHGDEFVALDKTMERTLAFAKLKAEYRMTLWLIAIDIKAAIEREDELGIVENFDNLSPVTLSGRTYEVNEIKEHLWIAETKGGFFSMAEKEIIRAAKITTDESNED